MSRSEITVAAPLSGEEIMDSIESEVRRQLMRDCHMNPALGYEAFEAEILIKLKLKDTGREVDVEANVRASRGRIADAPVIESFSRLEPRPPNVVRQAAGMPIPTLVEEASGRREVKPVKYAQRTEHEPGKEHEHDKKEHEKEHEKHGDPQKPGQSQPGQQPKPPGQDKR